MEVHADLIRWAEKKGIVLDGIKPLVMPGKGTGMVATRDLEVGETLLLVPTQSLRSLGSIPKSISRKLPRETSLHAQLAAYVTLDPNGEFELWKTSFPDLASFSSTPLMWPQQLQALLPQPAQQILEKQQTNFQKEWSNFSDANPTIKRDNYLHSWLLVNSRSFYYTTGRMERLPHGDRLALLPIADLFNHSDQGCETKFSLQNYQFIAARAYRAGDEVHVCYGGHSNDFLLAEYGFMLSENRWDAVRLDDILLPHLSKEQKDTLRDSAFLGKYMLDQKNAVCFRTQVALRILCCSHELWQSFVDGEDDGETSQRQVDDLLLTSLNKFVIQIQKKLKRIDDLKVGEESQRELLVTRWTQIQRIVTQTIERLDH